MSRLSLKRFSRWALVRFSAATTWRADESLESRCCEALPQSQAYCSSATPSRWYVPVHVGFLTQIQVAILVAVGQRIAIFGLFGLL